MKKKKYIISIVVVLLFVLAAIILSNTAVPFCVSNSISVDSEKNVYVVGSCSAKKFFGTETNHTILIKKVDASETVQWVQRWSAGADRAFVINSAIDRSGNVYVLGSFNGSLDLGSATLISKGLVDVFLVKVNASGEVEWGKQFGGSEDDVGVDIATDSQGNVYITGGKDDDIFTAKINTAGEVVWEQQLGGYSITVDNADNVYIAGGFNDTLTIGTHTITSHGDYDVYLGKMNAFSEVQWLKSFGGTLKDFGRDIAIDSSGNAYILGSFQESITV